jgi:aerobic carbon-monoxide dehydrogenase medium subunit
MIPAPFEYEVAGSVDEAIELLGRHGEDAKLLAGGHSLLPLMKLRLARPSALIDIGRIGDRSYVREDGDGIAIGALTRHHDVHHSPVLGQHCPLVSHTAGLIGDPQVRHMGTIGGTVAHGDPASDMPAVLAALDADLVIQGPGGTRSVGAADFFRGVFETDLGPQDVLTELRVPKLAPGTGWSYQKFHRRAQDWAIVGVAAVVQRSNGQIAGVRIGLTNMGGTPLRARAVEQALVGAGPDTVPGAAQEAAEGTSPPSDTNATGEFRRHLATVLVRRAVEEALAR